MTKYPRFLALSIAVVVNSAALVTVHVAMAQISEQEHAAQFSPERVVVTAQRSGNYKLAANVCPASNTL